MNDKLGKEAEDKIKQWLDRKDDGYAFYRLYDIMTGYYGQYNISDFICYKYPYQWFIESKATWEDRFDICMISETQYNGLMEMAPIPGVAAVVIVLFASYQRAFIIDIREIDRYQKESGMKSFNIKKIDQWPFKYSEIQTIPNNRKKLLDYTGDLDDHLSAIDLG